MTPSKIESLKKAQQRNIEISLERILTTETKDLTHRQVRKKLLIEQDRQCFTCGLKEWNGLPLTLELEHKDGNKQNNERCNVVLLCPNCHSQTPHWRKAKAHPNWRSRQDSNL